MVDVTKKAEEKIEKDAAKGKVAESEDEASDVENEEGDIISVKFNFFRLSPKRLIRWYSGLGRSKKIIVGTFISFLLMLVVFIPTALVLKLDSLVFPSTLQGYVTDGSEESMKNVKICVGNKCTYSDDEGYYKLHELSYGERQVKVSKEGFQTVSDKLNLKRGGNTKDYELKVQGVKDIMGKFFSKEGELIKVGFKLIAGENVYDIDVEDDGSFVVKNVELQNLTIEIYSPDYLDSSYKIDPSESEIDLGEIDLTPASDISFASVDFLSKEALDSLKVEDVDGEGDYEVEIIEGVSSIQDLEVGASVNFIITKDGYNQKEIEFNDLEQGDNSIGEFPMSKVGKIVYTSSRTGNSNIYLANYDGTEETRLTDNKGDSEYPYYNEQEGVVYFISDRDGIEGENGYVIDLVYKVNVTTAKIEKVSQNNYDDYDGVGTFNLKAMRRVYNREHPDFPDTWQIMSGHINGTGTKQLMHSADSIYNYVLSDSGNLLMYTGTFSDSSNDGVYLFNTQTLQQNRIYENKDNDSATPLVISSDGNYGLLRTVKSGQNDLAVRDFSNGETVQLTNNSTYETQVRFGPDNVISYVSNRDSQNDIYLTDISSKQEQRITESGEVYNYVWVGDLILYSSENQLWIVDPEDPENAFELKINGNISPYFNFSTDFMGWD